MFKNKIDVVRGFQTSVNIAFDLHNNEKIRSFIPTMSSIDIVEDVLHSINSPTASRARLLVGAYGRGKSHIILVLISLLFKKDVALFNALLNKMKEFNPKLFDYALEYLKSNRRILPVIVNGNSASITQSFLNALQQTLKNENLEDIMPDTNFIAAINAIKLWQKKYPDTYAKFTDSLGEPISAFIVALKEFDVNAYDRFIKLYPKLTSGSEFNPFVGFDVIELYEKVLEKLRGKGYDGVYIIYDEFSKYLESSIAYATVSDTKLLQCFAEKCDRSGDKQMHLMLISHKDISNYIDSNLPKEKVDGWRGVSGRFKHMTLHNNFSQMYEIISAVIKKKSRFWEKFCSDNSTTFNDMEKRFVANGLLEEDIAEVAVRGCYPLHPVSTFVLPRLSEKVAQNERTLFTFLSADHKHTLVTFLDTAQGDFPVLTPDYIYDYFEDQFRKEHYTSGTHKMYTLTTRVLSKLDAKSLGAKIIKTIALFYMIEQFEKLPPIYERVIDTFKDTIHDISEIEKALQYLIDEKCIVYLKRSNGYLKIKESSGVDIQGKIDDAIEREKDRHSANKILNDSSYDSYMYPTSYNDEMEITRFFDFTFIDGEEFIATENWERKIETMTEKSGAVGVLCAIISRSDEKLESIREALFNRVCDHNRVIFALPIKHIPIDKICFEYSAVKFLRSDVVEDNLLADEYDIFIEDLEEIINSFIVSYTRPEAGGAEYYHVGKRLNLKRKAQLSAHLSNICYQTYPNAPVINNESINKDNLPAVAINSRNKLLAGLLNNELDVNLGLTGTGQDVSFMRSTLVQTGILLNESTKPEITLTPSNENMKFTLSVINDFLMSSNSCGRNFKELYDTLIMPQYGYGLKKGVIPILIAAVLHHHKKYIVIKNKGTEVKITPDLLSSINESSQSYTVFMESWNEEKSEYIESLASLFADYVSEKEKDYNTFSYIVFAMCRWYMSLPKYSKELTEVYSGKDTWKKDKTVANHVKFLNGLKQPSINAREFLFEKLIGIYGFKGFRISIVDNIKCAKELFDGAKDALVRALIIDVKEIFGAMSKKGASLTSIVRDWHEGLKPTTINHLFPDNEQKILQLMASVGNDEKAFIERLAKTVIGLRLDDWDKKCVKTFLAYLNRFKDVVINFDTKIGGATYYGANIYKLSFINKSGAEVVKTFEKTEYSERAKLLLNAITTDLEEMGQSISEQEKRQVLMELLETMC
jgi:nitrogen regulatory protein PII-like uncharacterized protein